MTKNKNSDLKSNNVKGNVLEKSKIIKKNKKKNIEGKKKLQQAVTKKVEKPTTAATNGNTEAGALVNQKKPKKNKSKQNKDTIDASTKKNSGNKFLGVIEKKNAKKLAKKLKKQAKKEEAANKTPKGKDNTRNLKSKSDNKEPKEHDPNETACTIFVGNLPVNTKRAQLVRLFKDYGPINGVRFRTANGKVLFKHKHRKEAGTLSAWIVLKDAETVTRALILNGTVFKNNHLRVTRGNEKSSSMDTKRTIFVGNLKYSANEEKLREIFSSCGDIEYVRCLNDDKGCKGVAYVCFKGPEAVGLALELNETMLDERPIHVERYSIKKLGAKKTRDVAEREIRNKSDGGKVQKDKKKVKGDNSQTKKVADTSKKSKFRGVKVEGGHVKKQKKKVTSQMQKLAKKIAPKEKS
ncbi:PREDICTED: nucleolar protein 12 [Bactrocera latifrons]|uniref:Nucleolar protein 12 n=1 Tax=Bactrocera latifrons TaxID=174628 RepID=A0A0K8WFV9_BACLA|nr:PREDICTED: nucleolar protein 12 [Bactrocera latifrons]